LFVLSLSQNFAPTPKTLIGASALLIFVAAIFGALNVAKVKTLRSAVADTSTTRTIAEQDRARKEKELKAREAAIAAEQAKLAQLAERKDNTGAAEGQLAQILNEKRQLEAKLQNKEAEILALQKQIEEKQPASVNPGAPSVVELQAQLDDARQQLDSGEREKSLLSEKLQSVRERSSQLEDEKKRRAVARGKVGVRGTILAVNQAYNFVVLNLGGRNGVEPHSEMLIVRDGSFIGKIRISSVEPASAIGDIITSTLARGVQVQPGDTVIYAGTNS
jgi:vacuolar-type H+-ATPase subunit I/STV1